MAYASDKGDDQDIHTSVHVQHRDGYEVKVECSLTTRTVCLVDFSSRDLNSPVAHSTQSTPAMTDRTRTYTSHLTTNLLPSLEQVRRRLAKIDHEIAE